MAGPLEGITVLDFTRLLPGPFATQLLCNLGADVIKIEDPGIGDYMRTVPPTIQGVSYAYLMVNRGKKSLAVDLKRKEGREILRKLVPKADIVMEQFRPGVMKRLGADYATLSKINPKLIYCSFSGYGQTGPMKDVPGHDITFEAHAGILGVTGGQDGRPVIPGVPMADLASGYNAAFSVLVALRTRDRTGRGEFIDVSIFDTAVSLMVLNLARYLATGEEPVAGETLLTGSFPFYNLYETADGGWMAVAAVEPKFWARLCEVVGAPELRDFQFADEREKAGVVRTLRARFKANTKAEWEAVFAKENLPVIGVRHVSDVVKDPQVKARNLLPVVDVPGLWKMPVIAHPAKHSVSEARNPARAPAKGEDTEEVLASLGYTASQIEELAQRGIVAR
jgi:crotonobetainyl-CoA:carnitine CoA-transferase CaiB-like acyl-CoA transferase